MPLRKSVRPVIDSLIIGALLVAANFVFGGSDRGWLNLNPSPYLILPLLIGGKYGLRSGLAAGVMALAASLGMACSSGEPLLEVLKSAPLVFLALPTIGLISGELQRQAAGRRAELEEQNVKLGQSKEAFEKDLEVARESQHLLQKELTLHGADACSLDIELRKIFEPGAPAVLTGTLVALGEVSRLTDAAFYLLDGDGGRLERSEFVGDVAYFPEEIGSRHTKMAWSAIEVGELVTCRGLGEGRGNIGKARFLAAVPWRRGGEVVGVLMIYDMPFLSMNWQTLARIELVCDWVSAMEDVRERAGSAAPVSLVDQERFQSMLVMAGRSLEGQGLPSAIALLSAVGAMTVSELSEVIASELRPTDIAMEVEGRGLAILFPLEAGRDAEGAAERYRSALSAAGKEVSVKLLDVGAGQSPDALWEELVKSI